jgi:hypothetical protein
MHVCKVNGRFTGRCCHIFSTPRTFSVPDPDPDSDPDPQDLPDPDPDLDPFNIKQI